MCQKTKTKQIIDIINNETYTRTVQKELTMCTKQETKTLIISRYRMLECGKNFKGTMKLLCNVCNLIDDEDHRLNSCQKFADINQCKSSNKINFEDVYSNDIHILRQIIPIIERIWNVKTSNGTAHT